MRTHLVPTRGTLVAVALVLAVGAGTLGAGPAAAHLVANDAGTTAHAPRVTPDAAERRYASCVEGAPATPRAFEAWSTRCRERVAAGKM